MAKPCTFRSLAGEFFRTPPWAHGKVIALYLCAMRRLNGGFRVSLHTICRTFGGHATLNPAIIDAVRDRNWYAVFTLPRNEKSVAKHLDLRGIESFLPTYEAVRVWKNRQLAKVILPLFPTYLFVHINFMDRVRVLQSPGVVHIVGTSRGGVPLSDSEVEFLRFGVYGKLIEPYREPLIGERVRITNGVMQGLQGMLVRKRSSTRFVLTLELINQYASIQVNAEDLESIVA
jgi:transcription antitermination factor NusG